MSLAKLWIALIWVVLAGCTPHHQAATPALWEVRAPDGRHGWLFGTIHALPAPLDWRTPTINAALHDAGELIVEVASLNDDAATAQTFQALSHQAYGVPVAARVSAAQRPALAMVMAQNGLSDQELASRKTWAVALILANSGQTSAYVANGIDRALLADTRLPTLELEGTRPQLTLFDTLPEASQRVLLAQAVSDAPHAMADAQHLAQAWAHGDMAMITRETSTGLLSDPVLRQTLFVNRNQRWAPVIARAILAGQRPFVAVGAAHMAGEQGLPALLTAAGFQVYRVE